MEELSVANNMEAEVLQGVYRTPENRMGAISRAASKPANPELETGKVKKGISQVVKELEDENKEVFQDKEETADTVLVSKESGESGTTPDLDKKANEKTILGMKPLTFGLVFLGVGVATYFAIKHFKGKKQA